MEVISQYRDTVDISTGSKKRLPISSKLDSQRDSDQVQETIKAASVLTKSIGWNAEGISYEPDQRHAGLIIIIII